MTDSVTPTEGISSIMAECLNLDNPKSFFLFAGAGSGKTRALVEAMMMFRNEYGQAFRLAGRKVAVITYTNAACDEIKHRIDYDSIFTVSTIHSFAWELIRPYYKDIREWLRHNLEGEIDDLQERQGRGRTGKAATDRIAQIESTQRRLDRLDTIKYFIYNPNGENTGKNSLNHTEVIAIAADFLTSKPLMQKVLIRKHPVVLIDESQDTQKDLIDAFFAVQSKHSGEFCLSLFGDTMQRIYSDGKTGLGEAVPEGWEMPVITINHRCPKRIVRFINAIRSDADDHIQEPRKDAPDGFVRLFLVRDDEDIGKNAVEEAIAGKMAEITSDDRWSGDNQEIKTLTLEHHMAARRGGFSGFFEPLYQVQQFKTGLLNGTLGGIPFFSQQVLPLVKSLQSKDKFAVAQIIKKYSPLVSADRLKASESSFEEIRKADAAVRSLFSLWDNGSDPLLVTILKVVSDSDLFAIPDVFAPIVSRTESAEDKGTIDSTETFDNNEKIDAWDKALSAPFSQIASYVEYISDKSRFGTHQGIKGLQFPRVMVVLDDNEARGFMFSYDKLFGAKTPTSTDIKNEEEGKETSIDRTRRLFYVTCSRAQSSLAVVVYTKEPDRIKEHLKNLKWFDDNEIVDIGDGQQVKA
jgi:DNA helicase II / ATP-dependent DNA helicase PcrA